MKREQVEIRENDDFRPNEWTEVRQESKKVSRTKDNVVTEDRTRRKQRQESFKDRTRTEVLLIDISRGEPTLRSWSITWSNTKQRQTRG